MLKMQNRSQLIQFITTGLTSSLQKMNVQHENINFLVLKYFFFSFELLS